MGIWKSIKSFCSWIWNDTPNWPEGLEAAEKAEALRVKAMKAGEDLVDDAGRAVKEAGEKGAKLGKELSSKIANTKRKLPALLTSAPAKKLKKATKKQVESPTITMLGAKKTKAKPKSAKKAAPKKATKKPRK